MTIEQIADSRMTIEQAEEILKGMIDAFGVDRMDEDLRQAIIRLIRRDRLHFDEGNCQLTYDLIRKKPDLKTVTFKEVAARDWLPGAGHKDEDSDRKLYRLVQISTGLSPVVYGTIFLRDMTNMSAIFSAFFA